MLSSTFIKSSTDMLRLLAVVFAMMLLRVSSSPVPSDPWADPCSGLSATPPSTVTLADLLKLLKEDAQNVKLKATELKNFYTTQQPGESQPRVTAGYVDMLNPMHLPNFPSDYVATTTGNLTLILQNDYKQLSRVAIYCHAMIKNEIACDLKTLALTPLNALKSAVYYGLCHIDLTVRKLNSRITSYENSDAVLPPEVKNIPESCPADRAFYDYIIAKDTVHYAAELYSQYVTFSLSMSSGK